MTLGKALIKYRERVTVLKKGFLQETYRIEQILRHRISQIPLREVSTVDIAEYRDSRLISLNPKTNQRISPATVRLELALLSNLFEIAIVEWGECDDNPVKRVRKPKSPPGRERRLASREEKRILDYAKKHSNRELYSIIVLALETAMRQSEILGLTWDNINFKTSVARLPDTKNGTIRDVPLSVKALEVIMQLGRKDSGRVFSYTPAGLKSTWRTAMLNLNIQDLHFHDLRHEAISRLFELGSLDMMEVAAISGHKSLSMLKRYTHLKAHRLVKKLAGARNKARQVMLYNIVPYPAAVADSADGYRIEFLDWADLCVTDPSLHHALDKAQAALLKTLVRGLRDGNALPQPSEVVEQGQANVILVDPLG